MFSGLSNIIEIDFSYFDTSEVNNINYLFNDCINLKKITFGNNFQTSLIRSMISIFYNCYSLTTLDLSNFNTTLVNNMKNMFYNCTLLSSIIFSNNFKTEEVTTMANMFFKCQSLISLNLIYFYTPLVQDMSNMFTECISLEYLNIENFDTSKTTSFNFMFYNCKSLKSLNLSNFNTENVLNMNEMFNGCNSLTVLDVSNFNTNLVTKMNKMFKNCKLLTSLDLTGFNTSLVTELDSFFDGCKLLKSIDISKFNTSSCTSMANMFSNCELLTSINISNFDTSKVENMKNMFLSCSLITSLDFSNFDTSKVVNFQRMFDGCISLKFLNLSNFNTNLVENMEKMFFNCINLISLDISNFNTSLCNNYISMFNNCKQLISLNLSSFDTSKITNMEKMFYNCSKITSLDLSNFKTSIVTNMISMFENCYNLNYINMNNFEENDALNNKDMFKGVRENLIYCIRNESIVPNIKLLLNEKNCKILDCTKNWEENYENMIKEKKNDINVIYDKCIIKDFKTVLDDFYFSNEIPGISTYIYNLENVIELKEKYTNLTFIVISEEKKKELLGKFGVDQNEELYVFITDFLSNDSKTATSDFKYVFILGNGTYLNLSQIKEDFDINIYLPIRNLSLANFDYAKEFSKEGYDIYNKKDNFYNDICSSASKNNSDIILKDRKTDIYPNNITLCKDNCEYQTINLENKRMVCLCNINANKNNETNKEEYDFLINNNNNTNIIIEYILDNLNYKIFKCYYLILSIDNLVNNPSFYIVLIIFIISLICSISFYFIGISNIRVLMYKELPTDLKLRQLIIKHLIEKKNRTNNIFNNELASAPKRKIEVETTKTENNKNSELKNFNSQKIILSLNKSSTNLYKKFSLNKVTIQKENSIEKDNLIIKNNKKYKENNKDNYINISNKIKIQINYNKIPFTQALREDKRSIFQIIKSLLFERVEILIIFFGPKFYRTIIISQYLLLLLLNLFFNTLFYSDEIVSRKYHNNGKLDFIVTFALSLISTIITSIFVHYIDKTKIIAEKLELIKGVKDEKRYLFWLNKYLKSLKQKIIIFIILEIMIIIGCFYYISIFFILYNKTRKSLLINYMVSIIEMLLKSLIVPIIITITRKIGISYKNIYLYNFSKFIDEHF